MEIREKNTIIENLKTLLNRLNHKVEMMSKESVNLKIKQQDFPGGPVVENPPAIEGDMDPWSGKIHMQLSN